MEKLCGGAETGILRLLDYYESPAQSVIVTEFLHGINSFTNGNIMQGKDLSDLYLYLTQYCCISVLLIPTSFVPKVEHERMKWRNIIKCGLIKAGFYN